MRPVDRGPTLGPYANYQNAKQDLVNRLGSYCSYCERRIATLLAVEHIQPKALPQYAHLECEWTNFLLGCVNCNSAKSKAPVECSDVLLPDRDNTFVAYAYSDTGMVEVAATVTGDVRVFAEATRNLAALNRLVHPDWDEDVAFSALERVGQRVQALEQAKEALKDYEDGDTCVRAIAREATSTGFFSIWMKTFKAHPEVRRELICKFPNTAVDCFDANTNSVSPRPNNGLPHGGKL